MTPREFQFARANLTVDQQRAFDAVMSGENTFITGGAGVGKSHLTQIIIYAMQQAGKNVLVCAPTGAAANQIGGMTLHRVFNLPLGPCITTKKLQIITHTNMVVRAADVLIIDEISMCRMDVFDAVVASLQKIQRQFGRHIQLVVVGDFCQIPPVLPYESCDRELLDNYYGFPVNGAYAFMSHGWKQMHFKVIILSQVVRQRNREFAEKLNQLRLGDASVLSYFNQNTAPHAIPNAISLYPYTTQVNKLNRAKLDALPGPLVVLDTLADDHLTPTDCTDIPTDLQLKCGANVVFTSNFNSQCAAPIPTTNGRKKTNGLLYVNGTTGTIENIHTDPNNPDNDELTISIDDGPIITLTRQQYPIYTYNVRDGILERSIIGHYYQFPVQLAYALTIHKAQGKTYQQVNVNPTNFTSGQLYVALSRVTDITCMHITRLIVPDDLILDPDVITFYESIETT